MLIDYRNAGPSRQRVRRVAQHAHSERLLDTPSETASPAHEEPREEIATDEEPREQPAAPGPHSRASPDSAGRDNYTTQAVDAHATDTTPGESLQGVQPTPVAQPASLENESLPLGEHRNPGITASTSDLPEEHQHQSDDEDEEAGSAPGQDNAATSMLPVQKRPGKAKPGTSERFQSEHSQRMFLFPSCQELMIGSERLKRAESATYIADRTSRQATWSRGSKALIAQVCHRSLRCVLCRTHPKSRCRHRDSRPRPVDSYMSSALRESRMLSRKARSDCVHAQARVLAGGTASASHSFLSRALVSSMDRSRGERPDRTRRDIDAARRQAADHRARDRSCQADATCTFGTASTSGGTSQGVTSRARDRQPSTSRSPPISRMDRRRHRSTSQAVA